MRKWAKKGAVIAACVILSVCVTASGTLQAAAAQQADTAPAQDVTSRTWDTAQWIRISRDYQELGDQYFFYFNPSRAAGYEVYRENIDSGKQKRLLKIKVNSVPEFYTNGKKLVWIDYKNGSRVSCMNLDGSGKKIIVDLGKYATSSSVDIIGRVHLTGNTLYYSKYRDRGFAQDVYTIYQVNLKTGKQKAFKNGYIMAWEKSHNHTGRYLAVRNKKGKLILLDSKSGKAKKLAGMSGVVISKVNKSWYYVTCTKQNAKKKKYTVYRVGESGGGKKKVASFSASYPWDDLMELTDTGATFMVGEKSMEYVYGKKKFVKRKKKNTSYYEIKAWAYM